jgi:hypothetical protein
MRAVEQLFFSVDEWDADGKNLVEVLARARNFQIARAAYDAAKECRPDCHLTLRQGARVISERRPKDCDPTNSPAGRMGYGGALPFR